MEERSPRRSLSHRSTTPYGSLASASFNRPRRSRPEPYQLDALKELFSKTSTPTIEERSALALEVGMYVIMHAIMEVFTNPGANFTGMSEK